MVAGRKTSSKADKSDINGGAKAPAGNEFVRRPQQHTVQVTSRNTISVGCKLPNGMHLDIRQHGSATQRVTLKGINSLTAGAIIRPAMRGGFAITENVPKEFFEEWMRLNSHHPAVANGLIFAHEEFASVKDMADERADLTHGFEPINPAAPGKNLAPMDA